MGGHHFPNVFPGLFPKYLKQIRGIWETFRLVCQLRSWKQRIKFCFAPRMSEKKKPDQTFITPARLTFHAS